MPRKQQYRRKDAKPDSEQAPGLQQKTPSEAEGFVNKTNQPPTDDLSGKSSYVGKNNEQYGGI